MKNKTKKRSILKLAVSFLFLFGMILCSAKHPAQAAVYENDIPAIYQLDYTDVLFYYNGVGKTVKGSGCGPTSVSMVIRYYTGDTSQTPETLFKWTYDQGYYFGDGTSHTAMDALCGLYNIDSTWTNDRTEVTTAIKNGDAVIAHMGPGQFTSTGHYIVLTGYKIENGVEKVRVNDPNSRSRTGCYYDLDTVMKEKRALDCGALMICSYVRPNTPSTLKVAPTLASTSLTVGNSCNISGSVSSNYAIHEVTGYIINKATGTVVQSESIKPYSKSVSLYSTDINKNLKFGTLSAGNYTLKITASDASKASKEATVDFTVKGKTSTLTVSPSLAATTLSKGSSCNILGSVTSNNPITKVKGYIINSAGATVQSYEIAPNTTSVNLKSSLINTYLKFGKLSAGKYTFKVRAWDSYGADKTSASISFKVLSSLTVSPSLASSVITKGSGCNVTGSVTSDLPIRKIVGSIVNASGQTVQTYTIYPNTYNVTLKNTAINTYLRFGTLARGNYRLKVTALDDVQQKTAYYSFKIQ